MRTRLIKVAEFLAVFVVLYALGSYLLLLTLRPWTEWHLRNCFADASMTTTVLCDVSRPALTYYWLFFVPVLLILAYVIIAAWGRHDQA